MFVVSGPVVQNVLDLGSPKLVSPRESVLLNDSSSLLCQVVSFISLGDWQNDATKLEDRRTIVKGKKSKFSIPPLDKNLWSRKGCSKS